MNKNTPDTTASDSTYTDLDTFDPALDTFDDPDDFYVADLIKEEEEFGEPVARFDQKEMTLHIDGGETFVSIISVIIPALTGATVQGIPKKARIKVNWRDVSFLVSLKKNLKETKKEITRAFWREWTEFQYKMGIEKARQEGIKEVQDLYRRIKESGPVIVKFENWYEAFERMSAEKLDILLGADMAARVMIMYRNASHDKKIKGEFIVAAEDIVSAALNIPKARVKEGIRFLKEMGWNYAQEMVQALQVINNLRAAGIL